MIYVTYKLTAGGEKTEGPFITVILELGHILVVGADGKRRKLVTIRSSHRNHVRPLEYCLSPNGESLDSLTWSMVPPTNTMVEAEMQAVAT